MIKEIICKIIWFIITLLKNSILYLGGEAMIYVFGFKEIIDSNSLTSLFLISLAINFIYLIFEFKKEWDKFKREVI